MIFRFGPTELGPTEGKGWIPFLILDEANVESKASLTHQSPFPWGNHLDLTLMWFESNFFKSDTGIDSWWNALIKPLTLEALKWRIRMIRLKFRKAFQIELSDWVFWSLSLLFLIRSRLHLCVWIDFTLPHVRMFLFLWCTGDSL